MTGSPPRRRWRTSSGTLDLANTNEDAVRLVEEMGPEAISEGDVQATPVVKLTNLIIRDGILQGASDVHIEPGRKLGTVRYRVDGVLRKHMDLPMSALNRVVSRVKILSRLDITDRLRPQDGKARVQVDNGAYDLRVSTIPAGGAEKCVIRILDSNTSTSLEDLNVPSYELVRLRQLMAYREGIVVVTGPTGSGKTSTLYGVLRELADGKVNIMTVEDPIEYELSSITQTQVETKQGLTFAKALRSILRQDPDVILVGEIRDRETAETAAQAAMTGHLVLATVHANDAVSAVPRLVDLGLQYSTIASTLRGALAQRLIRKVCGILRRTGGWGPHRRGEASGRAARCRAPRQSRGMSGVWVLRLPGKAPGHGGHGDGAPPHRRDRGPQGDGDPEQAGGAGWHAAHAHRGAGLGPGWSHHARGGGEGPRAEPGRAWKRRRWRPGRPRSSWWTTTKTPGLLMRTLLEKEGFEIHEAEDGHKALDILGAGSGFLPGGSGPGHAGHGRAGTPERHPGLRGHRGPPRSHSDGIQHGQGRGRASGCRGGRFPDQVRRGSPIRGQSEGDHQTVSALNAKLTQHNLFDSLMGFRRRASGPLFFRP